MSQSALRRVLEPSSVAILGASTDPTKRGNRAVRSLLESGFQGGIFPIHPDGGELEGLRVYPTVGDVPERPDLALIAVGASSVPQAVEQCARKGIAGGVILAVGFRESGEAGARLEREMVEIAKRHEFRLVGPNTSGILNPSLGLNLVGLDRVPLGDLAVLSQSGNIGLDLITAMTRSGVGLSLYVGIGNEGDIQFHEYLQHLENDSRTAGILVYSEGFADALRFLDAAERINATKPVVLLKGGRTESGGGAALTHTGAISGSYDVFRALARQRGLVLAERSDEFLGLAATLTHQPAVAPDRGVVIVADGGGHATIAADCLSESGVSLAVLDRDAATRLRELLGPAAATANPIDLAGAADRNPGKFAEVLDILGSCPEVGGILLTGLFGGYGVRFDQSLSPDETRAATEMVESCRRAGIPLVVHTLYELLDTTPLRVLRREGVPVLGSLECACRCMRGAVDRGAYRSGSAGSEVAGAPPKPSVVVRRAIESGRLIMGEWEARALLREYKVPLVPATLCRSPDEAADAAADFEHGAVLKLVADSVLHRTEVGGVALDLRSEREVREAFDRLEANSPAGFQGLIVAPHLPRPILELLVAVRRDAAYGPTLVIGAGGTRVELQADRAVCGLPLRDGDLGAAVRSLRIGPVFQGHRGEAAVPMAEFEVLVDRLSGLLLANPSVQEVELNPVFAYEDRLVAVDSLAVLAEY